jgi:trigger factor
MKVSVTETGSCRRSLSVDVPPDAVEAEFERVRRNFARKVKLDGFRQGKVPRHILDQRYGKEIEQEVVEQLIHSASEDAIHEAGLRPLHAPVLKDYKFARATGLSFVTEFEVRPRVTASGYRGLKITRQPVEVKETDVLHALDTLRERHARFEPIESRGVETGDHVLMDVEGSFEPGQGEPFSSPDAFFEIGSAGPHPEFTDEIHGMKLGEERTFGVKYPSDHPTAGLAGKRVIYKVKVKDVKVRHLPELNDEFAKELGSFDSLTALRERVREDLTAGATAREKDEARRQALDRIVEAHSAIEVPEALVDDQIEGYVEEVMRSMVARGMDPREARVDWEEIRREQREPARKSVRAMLLLDAIAEQEKLQTDDAELVATIEREAARRKTSPSALRAKWDKEGRTDSLKRQILREKVLDFLLSSANI